MAGLIPQAFIDDLLDRTSIVELINQHVTLKKRGNSFTACCPFHNEKSPSFNVSELKQVYHCFGCGASGNAVTFLMEHQRLGFIDALELLAEQHGLTLPRDEKQQIQRKNNQSLYELMDDVNQYYQQVLKQTPAAIDYLKQRGLSGEVAKTYQLGFAPNEWHNLERQFSSKKSALIKCGMLIEKEDKSTYDRYRSRIMFPIHDKRGRIVGFGGRVTDAEEKPKYLNSPETSLFHKSRELYGLYQALKQPLDSLLIVEGYMDVIALAEQGIQNAVATLGTATSREHIHLLSRHSQHLVFCFDGDKAGRKAAWRALEQGFPLLNDTLALKFMFLPEGEDPDSLVQQEGKTAFLARSQKALDAIDFFLNELRSQVDLHIPAGRSQLVALAGPFIHKLPHGTYREILLDKLALLTRIEKARLEPLLQSSEKTPPAETVPVPPVRSNTQTRLTPMRLALSLLLQMPKLYFQLEKPINASMLCGDGAEYLKSVLAIITPTSTSAQILEHFRDDAALPIIQKLTNLPLHVPTEGALAELEGALNKLLQLGQQQHIQQLLQKANHSGLNEQERHDLQRMIKDMKKVNTSEH